MAEMYSGCYSCQTDCINEQFCRDSTISLPKKLKIKVTANPAFWGFNDGSGNVLISGWSSFEKGHYDFFDGYDEGHFATKQCGLGDVQGPYIDEQRPDVFYRSVIDPEDTSLVPYGGKRHYGAAGDVDNIERGGAEVYLIDRQDSQISAVSADAESCDTENPAKIYKKMPENFGFGNKIIFTDKIFKNSTGAWRLLSQSDCYPSLITSAALVSECDGTPKQSIKPHYNFSSEYDQFQTRPSGANGCRPDGTTPAEYTGSINVSSGIYRASGVEDFLRARLSYGSVGASGLKNGDSVWFAATGFSGLYPIFGLTHTSTYSEVKLIGTLGSGQVTYNSGMWVSLDTLDPQTCCGKVAYNISDSDKRVSNLPNYHTDFGRIFNNSKNIRQSNRFIGNRYNYGMGDTTVSQTGITPRIDRTYASVSTVTGSPLFERELPYYGPFYEVDKYDTAIRRDEKQNTTRGNNQTCYSKKATLEVYPDCFAQWVGPYDNCTPESVYKSHQVSRLALVYRGCNYESNCSYDASGRPLGGWPAGAPTGINDLRQGLAGQEIYMYINLSEAWGAKIQQKPCPCVDAVGLEDPEMVSIPSPVTFSSFPKFDLYPSAYGCQDPLWQAKFAVECENGSTTGCLPPSSIYACDVRQPYTTYGYMRNLCGKSTDDRRKVITEAFSSLIQQGNYRNTNSSGTNLPMYWEFTNPYVHESGATGGVSVSGKYPYWGLSDTNGRLVSPYFHVTSGNVLNCDGDPVSYYKFNTCGTRQSGWPTSSVPFLVEIDHDDDCIGCASALMENSNLMLDTNGLSTEYSHARGEKYGWNHCRYKGVSEDVDYTCASGFDGVCTGSGVDGPDLSGARTPYIGNTCSCFDGKSFVLNTVPLSGTSESLGWTTWNLNNSYIHVPECDQDNSNDFFQPVPYLRSNGFSIYSSFKLGCEGIHKFLYPYTSGGITSTFLSNLISGSTPTPLSVLYGNTSCSRHYPSARSDLKLKTAFCAIPSGNEQIFELIPETMMDPTNAGIAINLQDSISGVLESLQEAKVFGCDTYLNYYGCSGVGGFYPCGDCTAGPDTALCDCPRIECDACLRVTGVDGLPSDNIPVEYYNSCLCDCNLQLMRTTKVDSSGGRTTVYNAESGPCSGIVVAIQYSGEYSSTDIIYLSTIMDQFGYGPFSVEGESACEWHTGPNQRASGIKYEFQNPTRPSYGSTRCDGIDPPLCYGTCSNDSNAHAGACGDPIPWTGTPPAEGVLVNKKSCYPEIMIVNKIECSGDYYNLYVSREYHSHGRTWEEIQFVGDPPEPVCFPKQKGVYRHSGTDCRSIPFCTPTDSVTPAYYSEAVPSTGLPTSYRGVCSAHYSSGLYKNQDFLLEETSAGSGHPRLWNYFNLFYESGYPNNKFFPAIYLGEADGSPAEDACSDGTVFDDNAIFGTGSYETPVDRFGLDWTNKFHSCLQDHRECGADLYCNKMFFPRRKYNVGTKVTKFGALQLCSSHSNMYIGDWYDGYEEFDTRPPILLEAENYRFIDGCDDSLKVNIVNSVGLDDVIITVDDYLPLVGINTGLLRYTIDVKSCLILSTGCHPLGTMSKFAIDGGIYPPQIFPSNRTDTMGYYFDKYTNTQADNCLFNRFKILVDVECCSSVIRRKNVQSDAPTMLEYVINGAPSWGCGGFVKPIACSCESSTCGGVIGNYENRPRPVCLTVNMARSLYATVVSSGDMSVCPVACTAAFFCCPTAPITAKGVIVSNAGPTPIMSYGGTVDSAVGYEHGNCLVPIGCCCSGTTPLGRPIGGSLIVCGTGSMISDNTTKNVWAYECGDYYYISRFGITTPGTVPDSCCETATLCSTLGNSWKVPKNGCMIMTNSNYGNHMSDYLNDCGCMSATQYTNCDTSIISASITEI